MSAKTCSRCGKRKDLTNFKKAYKGGNSEARIARCNECYKLANAATDKKRRSSKEYKLKERVARLVRIGVKAITVERVITMLTEQCGCCGICGEHHGEALCVDHNHETGEVRELLCRPCNYLVGLLEGSTVKARKAMEYIKKHKNKTLV